MTILRVPLPKGVPAFEQRVMLEQVEYVLQCRWNERAQRWFFELRDSARGLITSASLLPNWPLLGGLVHQARPPGELVAVDTQMLDTPIGLNDLGDRIVLEYIEAADVAELAGS